MERVSGHDWFRCLRCAAHAEQTWISARPSDGAPVRWSICGACRRITIWEGTLAAHAPAAIARASFGEERPAGTAMEALWDALAEHLAEQVEWEETPPRCGP